MLACSIFYSKQKAWPPNRKTRIPAMPGCGLQFGIWGILLIPAGVVNILQAGHVVAHQLDFFRIGD